MASKNDGRYELMAPAGSYPALAAAIRAGADAVYFGVDRLNMRSRSASPFTVDDLRRIARICRWCGVRSYLALNTVVYDEELPLLKDICKAAAEAGIDAVIAMDIAAIAAARAVGLAVHMSVQANISNIAAVKHYARYADVIVLARELNLEQIRAISAQLRAERICGPSGSRLRLEAFAHGALCVAIAGKCYMSLGLYNSSANRGECYQACRRSYRVQDRETGDELEIENRFVMSPRDLCTIEHLDKLADAGVEIFKLEGRGRSAHYVSTVTRAYRTALDALADGSFADLDLERIAADMERVFNRGFWSGGYYCGAQLGEWSQSAHSQATRRRVQLGVVSNYFGRIGVMEFELWQPRLALGSEILVEGPTSGAVETEAREIRVAGQSVAQARKGDRVSVAMPARVRRNDKVFLLSTELNSELA